MTRAALPLRTALAGLALVLIVPAAGLAATTRVAATASTWSTPRVRIVRGDTVEWTNRSFRDHSVTSWGRTWSMDEVLGVNGTVSRRFRTLGRFKYRCRQHSRVSAGVCEGMCGVIRVSAPE